MKGFPRLMKKKKPDLISVVKQVLKSINMPLSNQNILFFISFVLEIHFVISSPTPKIIVEKPNSASTLPESKQEFFKNGSLSMAPDSLIPKTETTDFAITIRISTTPDTSIISMVSRDQEITTESESSQEHSITLPTITQLETGDSMSETNGTSNITARKDRIQECPCIDYMDCPEIKELLNQMGKLSRASAEYKEKKNYVMSKTCDRKTKKVKCCIDDKEYNGDEVCISQNQYKQI